VEYTENSIRLDLEMTLATVRATIQADCTIALMNVVDGLFRFEVIVGERDIQTDWEYTDASGKTITVRAVLYKGIGGAEIEDDVMFYPEPNRAEVSLDDYWTERANSMARLFFEQNPEYQQAINA
jgi:hypothetical protein